MSFKTAATFGLGRSEANAGLTNSSMEIYFRISEH
jgi:hypothetical protein